MSAKQAANALFIITPYRYLGGWVFDDARVGLYREPFLAGIPEMINKWLAQKGAGATESIKMIFSLTEFPGYDSKLVRGRPWGRGFYYHSPDLDMEGWLCPALFHYFPQAPEEIFVKIEPLDALIPQT